VWEFFLDISFFHTKYISSYHEGEVPPLSRVYFLTVASRDGILIPLKKSIYMRKSIARIRGLGFILWHSRHELYHALLGLAWAWLLREVWGEFSFRWVFFAILGSLLPDADHLFYFVTYGKRDEYAASIKKLLGTKQWRNLTVFIEQGHKYNTDLMYHNIYFIALLLATTFLCFLFDWKSWVVLFGAMIIHYIFDILDDFVTLGYINPNWKRWGSGRKKKKHRR